MTKSDLDLWTPTHRPFNSANNANFNRLMYASGDWAPGTYDPEQITNYIGFSWRCLNTTTAAPSDVSADWSRNIPQVNIYTGAELLNITGTTPVVFSYDALNPNPSKLFTINAGNLEAIVSGIFTLKMGVVWTPTTNNNDDAGLVANLASRSGTGTFGVNDPFGSLFQSSRANTAAMGSSHTLGLANLTAGDVIGVDVSDYTGQSGTTDMAGIHLYVSIDAVG